MAIVPSNTPVDYHRVHSTPTWATRALLNSPLFAPGGLLHQAFGPVVWEPACGNGRLSSVLMEHPSVTRVVASDVVHREASTVPAPVDFLTFAQPPLARRPKVIVTNPPFSLSTKFIAHALHLQEGVPDAITVMFLPAGAVAGQRRYKAVYARRPPFQVMVFTERVVIYPDPVPGDVPGPVIDDEDSKRGVIEYAWFVWANGPDGRPLDNTACNTLQLAWIPPGTRVKYDPAGIQRAARKQMEKDRERPPSERIISAGRIRTRRRNRQHARDGRGAEGLDG